MRARLVIPFVTLSTVCSAAVDSAIRMLDAAIAFVFGAVTAGPRPVFAGSSEGFGGFVHTFADPHVERHEAGTSRRTAARAI